jgi:4-amino-4-deoxy-L-arabinose transferase-like glycosyltransferase
VTSSPQIDTRTSTETFVEIASAAAVLAVAAGAYALLFNRANVLSHSIGYNLYASERVLDGDIPYRDFHTLYPPAIFYLNAALFKWLGVSLYSALLGVFLFKALTVTVIYLSGRQLMPTAWALLSALGSLLWLRPNGPFKSVPMHYGALFLAAALFLLLKHENRRKLSLIFFAGASLGLVALFKHNIGAYALLGSLVFLAAEDRTLKYRASFNLRDRRRVLLLLIGCAATVLPVLAYMQARGAFIPMLRTILFGPGEFLLNRLAIPLSPLVPAVFLIALSACTYAAYRLRSRPSLELAVWTALIAAVAAFVLRGSQADVNQIIFYLPMLVLIFALSVVVFQKDIAIAERRALLVLFIFSAAALMELFPRFAREQSIAAMPFVMPVLFYLLYVSRARIRTLFGGTLQYRAALAVLPITFLLMEGRVFFNTYFDRGLGFKANAQLAVERGRGIYFPEATASLIDSVASYLQQRVPPGGYAFAQSDAGTSFLFLSERRNISNAQFWIGVGVTREQRTATLERIDKSQTKLIITSDDIMAAEKFTPMREYIERNFKETARFEDVVILER